ncbi:glycosyltransferase family 2 protein [Ferruginibacter sp.]
MPDILLSIIIPTKNRIETARYAIQTALTVTAPDMEIIVQDCSDTDELKAYIDSLSDSRVKYFFQNDPISMTENWNRAYSHANGEYMIGIGDDDAVFPEVYTVAEWAFENKLEAVGQTEPYQYFWGNFPEVAIQKRLFLKSFTGNVSVHTDLLSTVLKRSKFADDGYARDLPMVYHRLISKKTLQQLQSVTGKLLDGTSLDVYSSFAIGLICKQFVILDYPFSMRGASGKSNSGRFVVKQDKQHFDEFSFISYPEWLPKIPFVNVSIAESICKAFTQTGHEDLISNISKPYLYAVIIAERPDLKEDIMSGFVSRYLETDAEKAEFHSLYKKLKAGKNEKKWRLLAEKINMVIPVLSLYRKIIRKKDIRLNDTMEVLDFHKQYIAENGISLKLN